MLKWTVGIVNFRSIDYIENQLKILYEFNNPEEFELIVVDNSEPSEIGGMSELCAKYIEKHKNLILIERGNEFDDVTNSQHSSGLNLILMKAKGKYLLVQDPDFFWTQKNYLNTFEGEFQKGVLCIGAPYGVQIKTGKPDFPSSFGCAYIVDELKNRNLDFNAGTQEEKRNEHKYPGWKMRAEFSHMKYISFPQKISILPLFFGEHSYLSVPRYYKYNNKIIGYHLFRGSFVATNSISDWKNQKNIQISKHKVDTRYLYSKYFYGLISGSNFSFIKEVGLIKIAINIFKLCFCKIIVDEDGSQNPYHIIVIGKKIIKKLLSIK